VSISCWRRGHGSLVCVPSARWSESSVIVIAPQSSQRRATTTAASVPIADNQAALVSPLPIPVILTMVNRLDVSQENAL
jgi:hypothetical protein